MGRGLRLIVGFCLGLFSYQLLAAQLLVVDSKGKPLANVMVTQKQVNPRVMDTSDEEYQKPNVPFYRDPEYTAWTNAKGQVTLPDQLDVVEYRFRLFAFKEILQTAKPQEKNIKVKLEAEADPVMLAAAKPANVWLGSLDLGNAQDKKVFQVQCGFCHQQGTEYIRGERSAEEWNKIIKRMVGYGSRLPTELQDKFPAMLVEGFKQLREKPELLLAHAEPTQDYWTYSVTEWPIGDMMSQTHDMLWARNQMVYVADNIQDRLYEVNPKTNQVTVYKIPHLESDENGGLIKARLKEFPRHDSTSNAHSLAESHIDGHIFITPSAQKRLVEFDPKTKVFTLHQMKRGFYPHTIRLDQKDRVWFTLALSNQVAMFDRAKMAFTYYDLPTRSLKEKFTVNNIEWMFKVMNWGLPLSKWLPINREYEGTPLVYGIDVTPDGKVWFARLHTDEIGSIDPDNGNIQMVKTPFMGPRRLRADGEGNLWIAAFGDSGLARYNPKSQKFDFFPLPVNPKGSETPYSLNVDKIRKKVWVTGNQSDALYGFDIASETWEKVPLPRRTTFTRDIEITEEGTLYTSNSNFPSWHVEGAQPTLIEVKIKK